MTDSDDEQKYSIKCPTCDETFASDDPDEVAYPFGIHLKTKHDMHPAVVGWMEEMYRKRRPMQ